MHEGSGTSEIASAINLGSVFQQQIDQVHPSTDSSGAQATAPGLILYFHISTIFQQFLYNLEIG